jgi:5,5'-dehydrodivanillate O-demethylase oxygenase subunit
MLSNDKNLVLTSARSGSPMGELLRRYWHPIAPVLELREKRVKPVRLLGEDLVLFRLADGRHGLIPRACPHRGADLSYGWVEGDQIRCMYHGWAFDADGNCAEQPFEQARGRAGFCDKVKLAAYPTSVLGGLIWAYLGPRPAPLLPDFEPFSWNHGFVDISITELPCNWFQCHENGMDPVHFEWLHTNWTSAQSGTDRPVYSASHVAIEFAEFEFGFICGREVDETGSAVGVSTCRVTNGGVLCMWPHALMTGDTFEWRVPIDDVSTLNITWRYSVLPSDISDARQDPEAIPYWYGPLTDARTGRMIADHALNQDFTAWVGQGTVADREHEHLGRTDAGIILLRRRYLEEIERMAAGFDPPGVIRDQSRNNKIDLPVYKKSRYTHGLPRQLFEEELALQRTLGSRADRVGPSSLRSNQAGRPDHILAMYLAAAGLHAGRP